MVRSFLLRQILVFIAFLGCLLPAHGQQKQVMVLEVNSAIYASTADYIHRGFEEAVNNQASAVILKINTPGGLLDATRRIVGDMMSAPMPVIAYVAPGGAHAGSAGAFIALAADVTAMSPGTNIGAAHPVLLQGTPDSVMNKKMTEDAAAFIKSIAEKRGKDPATLIKLVTESKAYTAEEALSLGMVDLMANNLPSLLKDLKGRDIALNSGTHVTLDLDDAAIVSIEMSSKDQFLNRLNDPNVMYLLLLLGIMGILFEVFNPGGLAPGIIGAVCLILAGYGMSLLPVNYTGLALILLAIILFVLELKFPSHALLSISGVVCLGIGSFLLIKKAPSLDVVHISMSILISSIVITAAFFILLIGLGLKAQMNKTTTGKDAMIGETGVAKETLDPRGRVLVHGEYWDAYTDGEKILRDTAIEVVAVDKFILKVKSISLTNNKS